MPSTTLQRYRAMPMRALRSSGSRPCCLESGRMAETPVTRHGRHAKLRAVLWAESRAAGVLHDLDNLARVFWLILTSTKR